MSLRLSVLNVALRRAVRPFIGLTGRPETVRQHLAIATRLFLHARRTEETVTQMNGVRVREFRPEGASGDAAILYFHGGAYVAGSPETHRAMLSVLARSAAVRVLAPDYRLAPEHPFPAAFEDAVAVAEALDPARTVLGGDSAGGGLALALLAHLAGQGRPPAGCFAYSPWTDLAGTGASLKENAARDVLLPVSRLTEVVEMVTQGGDPADPRISPLNADFNGAPPVHLTVALSEILRDDTLRLARRLEESGVTVTTETLPHAPHVWPMLVGVIPEARPSLERTATFVNGCLSSTRPRSGN